MTSIASGSAGSPTSAAMPAELTSHVSGSRARNSASAIGLRQMLPVQTMRMRENRALRHSRAGGNPVFASAEDWIPAFAGMTGTSFMEAELDPGLRRDDWNVVLMG